MSKKYNSPWVIITTSEECGYIKSTYGKLNILTDKILDDFVNWEKIEQLNDMQTVFKEIALKI